MNYKNLDAIFFWISLGIHMFCLGAILIVNGSDDPKKPYIVFGAYSRKPTKVFFGTPRGKPHGHGTKRKGVGNGRTHRGISSGTQKMQAAMKTKKSGSGSNEHKGNGGKALYGGKKGKSNHDMKAASKLGKHDKKKCVKTSGFNAISEHDIKVVQRKKVKDARPKRALEQKKETHKKEKERKEQEIKREKERKEQERLKQAEEQKKLEAELEQKLEEAQSSKTMEAELEEREQDDKTRIIDDEKDDHEDCDDDDDGEEDVPLEFNLIGPDHADWAVYQKDIQKEVTRLWRPPLGVPRGAVCKIKFRVTADGNVESFELVERSKMLIYDLSIVRVAKNFKFDKRLWGKEFIIGFRQ